MHIIKKSFPKYKIWFLLLLITAIQLSEAVVVKKDKIIKQNKNYPKQKLMREFIQSRFFMPTLIGNTAFGVMFLGMYKDNDKLFSGAFITGFLSLSRMLYICFSEIIYLQEKSIYATNQCYKLMDPHNKVILSTTLFNTLYNNRLKKKSYIFTPREYDRLEDYYSVFQERGLPDKITKNILKEANILSTSNTLKKTPVQTKQLCKLLKHADLKPFKFDNKKYKFLLSNKPKKKLFIDNEQDKEILKKIYTDLGHFYCLKNCGWIHCRKQKNKKRLLFDSRYIDKTKEVDGKKIHPTYFSEFGFKFYEVINPDEQNGSLGNFYKFHEDPAFIKKARKELRRIKIIPGCSDYLKNPRLIFGLTTERKLT